VVPSADVEGAGAVEGERLICGGVEHAASTDSPTARQKLKRNIMRIFPDEQGVCPAGFGVISQLASGNIPRQFAQHAHDAPPDAGLKKVDLIKQRRYGLSRPGPERVETSYRPTGGISGEKRAG
jgi:hypothetical protein